MNRPDLDALREKILAEIRRLAATDGRTPGSGYFARMTHIRVREWSGRIWVNWGDAVREAGLEPNEFNSPTPESDLLARLARLARTLGHFPKDRELSVARQRDKSFPATTVFRRFGSKAQRFVALRAWVNDKPDFSDVDAMLAQEEMPLLKRAPVKVAESPESPTELSESWVPPVVACLPRLARGEGTNAEIEFERRVAVAFRLLGLTVRELGQGHGRTADCVAICHEKHWALVCDAKSRVGGFAFNATEERKFKEYVGRYAKELRPEGVEKIYLVIVSSDFDERDVGKAKELKRTTGAYAVALVPADVLVALVEQKLKGEVDLDDLERVVADTRIASLLK